MLVSQKKKKTAIHTHVHTIHTYYTHMWESLRAHKSSHIARWLRILGIRTNVDDDKAPLKAHLQSYRARGKEREGVLAKAQSSSFSCSLAPTSKGVKLP